MDKLNGMSMDIEQAERDKLQSLFPQCFKEGKLDIDMLLNLCGEYIDEDFEKYKFEWKGKAECFRIAGKRSTGTLRPSPDESVNFDTTKNLYIEGDNLEVLKLLQTAYFRKVKMIYIDPPYNTGNDFVYNDDFSDPIAHYKEVTSQATKSNPESMGRFHTDWLNMMWPRLRLAANLLRDDGVIFISIDDNEVRNLRMLCDEVFGEENFIAQIIVQSNPRGRQSDTFIASVHDYLLVYAKNAWECVINGSPLTDEQKGEFALSDENGNYRLLGLRQRGSASRREDRPDMFFPIYVNPSNGAVSLESQSGWEVVLPRKSDGTDGRWMWGKTKCQIDMNRLVSKMIERRGEYDIFVKDYLNKGEDGERTRKFKTIWDGKQYNNQFGTQEVKSLVGNAFSFPKSSQFLMDILRMGSNPSEDDIVLDFFSGSATTAHAVIQLNAEDRGNRRFVMVQLPEVTDEKSDAYKSGYKSICDIGKERIRRAGTKILAEWQEKQTQLEIGVQSEQSPPDIGFKVLKLDTSNLHTWDGTPISDENMQTLWERFDAREKTIKRDRSDLDLVFEVMLKMGIPLDYVVSEITVGERKCYSIGERPFETSMDCMILVCLDFGITPEDITAFCDLAPAKIIAAEEAFEDSTAMSNAHYILKDRDIEMKLL